MPRNNAPVSGHSQVIPSGALRRFFGSFSRSTDAASAVEFAILVPVLTLMVIAISDIGFAVYREIQVEDAAQAGAQWAVRNGFDSNGISNAVTAATNSPISASPAPQKFCGCATGSSVSLATCGAACPGGARAATYATVSAQLVYNTTLNYEVVPTTSILAAQAIVRLQ